MATRTKPAPADLSVDVKSRTGKAAGKATLAGEVFGIEPNGAVMHQVVTAQLAAARAGTHSTKTRAEARGGGAKPWRQKGTGRARQGSARAPHWTGGGVAHGPRPRDYSQRTPKKMVKLALRSALSDRAADSKILVVDGWDFEAPKTKDAKAALEALGVEAGQRVLVVLGSDDEVARRSFRNLEGERRVRSIAEGQLNAYEVLVADWIVFTTATLASVSERLGSKATTGSAEPAPVEEAADEASGAADEAADEGSGDTDGEGGES